MASFHQGYPYNGHCPLIDNQRCLVGCGPLAIGTVMGYYKWPSSADGYAFDWSSMYSSSFDEGWQVLFATIGKSYNTDANYGLEATGTYSSTYVRTFLNMGYRNAVLSDFSTSIVEDQLRKASPSVCIGYDGGGHAWVIDGGYLVKKDRAELIGRPTEYYTYYRCLWGWGTSGVGYYLYESNSLGDNTYDENEHVTGNLNTSFSNLRLVHSYEINR